MVLNGQSTSLLLPVSSKQTAWFFFLERLLRCMYAGIVVHPTFLRRMIHYSKHEILCVLERPLRIYFYTTKLWHHIMHPENKNIHPTLPYHHFSFLISPLSERFLFKILLKPTPISNVCRLEMICWGPA